MMKSMIIENGVTFKELEKNIYAWISTVLQQHTTTNSLEVFCSAASKHFFF